MCHPVRAGYAQTVGMASAKKARMKTEGVVDLPERNQSKDGIHCHHDGLRCDSGVAHHACRYRDELKAPPMMVISMLSCSNATDW